MALRKKKAAKSKAKAKPKAAPRADKPAAWHDGMGPVAGVAVAELDKCCAKTKEPPEPGKPGNLTESVPPTLPDVLKASADIRAMVTARESTPLAIREALRPAAMPPRSLAARYKAACAEIMAAAQ